MSIIQAEIPQDPGPACDLRVGLQVAQEATRVLAPLPVELLLFLLSLGLCLARLLPLLGLLRCLGLALLGAALSLLGLLTGYSAYRVAPLPSRPLRPSPRLWRCTRDTPIRPRTHAGGPALQWMGARGVR